MNTENKKRQQHALEQDCQVEKRQVLAWGRPGTGRWVRRHSRFMTRLYKTFYAYAGTPSPQPTQSQLNQQRRERLAA